MPIAFGVTATGEMVPLLVDSNGNLLVVPADDSPVFAKLHGYYSGAWQKAPLPFGPSDTVNASTINNSLAAGTNILVTTTVPAGEFWIVNNVFIRYIGTVAGVNMYARIVGTATSRLFQVQTPTSNLGYSYQGFWAMNAGDYMDLLVTGATAGDNALIEWAGFKMDTDL